MIKNIHNARYLWPLMLIVLSLIACSPAPAPCETGPFPVFPQFCQFYQANQIVMGDPISTYRFETVGENGAPVTIQYFEGMRLEYYPNGEAGSRLAVTPLGALLFDEPANPESDLEGPFLEIAQEIGLDVLGEPISDQRIEDGRLVQYFENTRLRYEPTLKTGMHDMIGLAHLIRVYPELLPQGRFAFDGVNPVEADVSFSELILNEDESQMLYTKVTVGGLPLEGVQISLVDHTQAAEGVEYNGENVFGVTDRNGVLEKNMSRGETPPGTEVIIEIRFEHASFETFSKFRTYSSWW